MKHPQSLKNNTHIYKKTRILRPHCEVFVQYYFKLVRPLRDKPADVFNSSIFETEKLLVKDAVACGILRASTKTEEDSQFIPIMQNSRSLLMQWDGKNSQSQWATELRTSDPLVQHCYIVINNDDPNFNSDFEDQLKEDNEGIQEDDTPKVGGGQGLRGISRENKQKQAGEKGNRQGIKDLEEVDSTKTDIASDQDVSPRKADASHGDNPLGSDQYWGAPKTSVQNTNPEESVGMRVTP